MTGIDNKHIDCCYQGGSSHGSHDDFGKFEGGPSARSDNWRKTYPRRGKYLNRYNYFRNSKEIKTIVSMGVLFPMQHEDAFTDARVYNPDRWLSNNAKALDKYFVPFSKGPRSCLGIKYENSVSTNVVIMLRANVPFDSLAWCELYLSFANLFRRFELTIDGTEYVSNV